MAIFLGCAFGVFLSIIAITINASRTKDETAYAMDLDNFNPFEQVSNGKNSTRWKPTYICPSCFEETTHDERMVGICTNCAYDRDSGEDSLIWHHAVKRNIVLNGEWVKQIKYRGNFYINKKRINKSDFEVKKND